MNDLPKPQARAPAPAALSRAIDLECVRTLYRQIPNSFAAAMVVTVYMLLTLQGEVRPPLLWTWAAVQAAAQFHRVAVYRAYHRAQVDEHNALVWASRYAGYMAVAGAVWGLAALLFIRPEEPLTVAFTMCGLYGITAGAVPGNAYHRPALMCFIWPVFIAAMLRLSLAGRTDYLVLGLASLAFAGILSAFCSVQARAIREALQVRFENRELLLQLAEQKAQAEAARQQAEQANLAKSQFLAAASHDLRQPLHALSLFSASMEGLSLDDEARTVVRRIQVSIDALEDLFDALLDISRLDAGVVQARPQPVALAPLLGALAHELAPVARERQLRLLARAPQAAQVRADPTLLRRILMNLASNGLRYTPAGGTVMLAARRRPGAWRLECRDNGTGIAMADQARVFDEFVQLHNPERDRRRGLGLGLAITQRSARLMGSEVSLRSAPGRGSVFALTLPAEDAASPRATPPDAFEDDGPLVGLSVWVIDDEAEIRDALAVLLGQWGCRVQTWPDAFHAEAALANPSLALPAVLLADLRLPGGRDGVAAIAGLRAALRRPLAAALITGESHPRAWQDARDAGLPVLHKPVRAAKLRALLLHLAREADGAR